jgi:hypothetical protein
MGNGIEKITSCMRGFSAIDGWFFDEDSMPSSKFFR